MKKLVLVLFLIGFIATSVFAAGDGAYMTSNVHQKAINVPGGGIAVSLPNDSIDIWIHNGDSTNSIWIELQATSLTAGVLGTEGLFILPKGETFWITDFRGSSIYLSPYGGNASPVSVVITY